MTNMQRIFGEMLAGAIELYFDSRCADMDASSKAYMISGALDGWKLPCGLLNAISAKIVQDLDLVVLCDIDGRGTVTVWSREQGWL
jgi:hypothetical protein